MTIARQPSGTPTGGQFAPGSRTEADVDLDPTRQTATDPLHARQPAVELGYGQWQVHTPPSMLPRSKPASRPGTILTWSLSPDPHERAACRAATAVMAELEQPDAVANKINWIAREAMKATILRARPDGTIIVTEGTGTVGPDGRPGLLAKGSRTKGIYLDSGDVLAVEPGYGQAGRLIDRYHRALDLVPAVQPATFDDLPIHDGPGEPPGDIAAVYLMDGPNFGEGPTPGCLFLVTDHDPDGIVNGYLWTPEESPLVSEHGSHYTQDLQQVSGRITGYRPGTVTFADCIQERLGHDRAAAYRTIMADPP